jgi:hypothetical protein
MKWLKTLVARFREAKAQTTPARWAANRRCVRSVVLALAYLTWGWDGMVVVLAVMARCAISRPFSGGAEALDLGSATGE